MRLSGLSFYVLYLQFLYLTEEIGCKDEVIQFLVARGEDIVFTAFPFFISVVDIDNFLTYSHDGVHIMSIDESGHIILMRDVVYQFVNDERCLWVQTRVWFIAEQVLRIQSNGTGNGDALLHTATDLSRKFVLCFCQVHAVQAEHSTAGRGMYRY